MSLSIRNDVSYLPGRSFNDFLEDCRKRYPVLYGCLDLQRCSGEPLEAALREVSSTRDFDAKEVGGRGEAYRLEQKRSPLVRIRGIAKLFELLCLSECPSPPTRAVLDVLGGNGTLARAMNKLNSETTVPTIITSDASSSMVADALEQFLPAVRQLAETLLFRDCSVDGVIFAYGTHHITVENRPVAFKEAYRVLKPGCKVVIQDFEENTPTARWYSELLDQYTLTGHKCKHFTRSGMQELMREAGFCDVQMHDVYDPFVIGASTADAARRKVTEHACLLFALEKLLVPLEQRDGDFWEQVYKVILPFVTFSADTLPPELGAVASPTVRKISSQFVAEFPRIALVGVGTKPNE